MAVDGRGKRAHGEIVKWSHVGLRRGVAGRSGRCWHSSSWGGATDVGAKNLFTTCWQPAASPWKGGSPLAARFNPS